MNIWNGLCKPKSKDHTLVIVFVLCFSFPSMMLGKSFCSPPPSDTIPVVVHVIHTGTPVGSAGNPSDSQIQSMITEINNAYQKNGPNYGGAVIPIAFQLANRSPQCGVTNGINRVNGSSVPKYVTGGITTDTTLFPNSAFEVFVKALSRWPNTDYVNIWIVNMIDGNPNGLEGYAYFPQYNSALIDGIVIRADAVNGTNKNIIHESGHFFSLYHTFGNAWSSCQTESDCTTDGDLICDTEKCMYMNNCISATNPCSGNNWIIADPTFGYTVLNNYMGYTNCQWMFTNNQKDTMIHALELYRPGLLSSFARRSGTSNIPAVACIPTAINGLSPYYGIERVEFGSLNVYSNSSLADAAFYIDRSCNQQIVVHAGDNVPVKITGSYENYAHIKVYLDYNNNGIFETPAELILSGDGGILMGNVLIPSSSIQYCTPLRLRVVSDHPAAPQPTPCMLTGTPADGVGQIEDYSVIIKPRQVSSIASGNWDSSVVWSCNCVPSSTDGIVINSGHTIIVPLNLGTVNCASIYLQPGAIFNSIANVHVAGGCE
jgi:hypothetical protein